MSNNQSELDEIIFKVAEGDLEFKQELTLAIYNALLELQNKYVEATHEKNESKILQIRHKLKPTLIMFNFHSIMDELKIGKEILSQKGFDKSFQTHFLSLNEKLNLAISEVHSLTMEIN